jgi:hypothetical protein
MGIVVVGGVEGGMLEAQARTFNEPRAARGGQGGVEGGSRRHLGEMLQGRSGRVNRGRIARVWESGVNARRGRGSGEVVMVVEG